MFHKHLRIFITTKPQKESFPTSKLPKFVRILYFAMYYLVLQILLWPHRFFSSIYVSVFSTTQYKVYINIKMVFDSNSVFDYIFINVW